MTIYSREYWVAIYIIYLLSRFEALHVTIDTRPVIEIFEYGKSFTLDSETIIINYNIEL